LAQKPSAKALPRAAFGKEPSENFETAKGSLPRAKKPSAKKNPRQNVNKKKPEKIAK
jgi:hypothetical protein